MPHLVAIDGDRARMFPDDGRVSWSNADGRVLTPAGVESHYGGDRRARPRVLQLTRYDPGSAAYRYHSAFNSSREPGGVSAFVRYEDENPHCSLRQYDGILQREGVRRLANEADVLHVHMDYSTLDAPFLLNQWHERGRQLLVRHYHGSQPADEKTNTLVENALDDREDAVQVGARLYHMRFSPRMYWLPIPVPVLDYEALARRHWTPPASRGGTFRIAHSPTHWRIKGTMMLEHAVSDLRVMKGLPIELVMIQGKSHGEALAMKATCDATFDSFWLGIQGSGLEAACMGQAVVAGDASVKEEYEREIGFCPYTFAPGFDELKEVLERLVTDPSYHAFEAARVAGYVRRYHDYPAVGDRYWQIIAAERAARGLDAEAA